VSSYNKDNIIFLYSEYKLIMNFTQARIIQYLNDHPSSKTEDISYALGITPAGTRYHLHKMLADHLIEINLNHLESTRGHPVYLFRLCSQALPNGLDHIAEIALDTLHTQFMNHGDLYIPQILAENFIRKLGVSKSLPSKMSKLTYRLSETAIILNQHKYQSKWEARVGSPLFMFGNCPYKAIVFGHPELCLMDKLILERLIAKPINQISKIGRGTPESINCRFSIII
jgi:predicted ArsR family transcriptional regulator